MTNSWIVVLNWNGRADTLELLESLKAADLPTTTVLVVDNDSSDSTLEAVQEQHPWVQTLQTGENLGFAGGNNRGIEFAIQHGADIVGVLNNDTLVSTDFWRPLIAAATQTGMAVSPDIRYANDPGTAWFYGASRSTNDGWPYHLEAHVQPARNGLQETELLTGCCLVANSQTWAMVGLFDEAFFLIFEDSDWSMRARRLGVHLLLEPRSVITHKVSRSFQASQSQLGHYYFCRNGLIFAWKWTGPAAAARFLGNQVLRPVLSDVLHARRSAPRAGAARVLAVLAAALGFRGKAGTLTSYIAGSNPRRLTG